MKKDLLDSITSQLKKAVSATTSSNIFLMNLPNKELLTTFTVVYELKNIDNINTLTTKEVVKVYDLTVKVNNPTTKEILANEVFIRDRLYQLPTVNTNVKYISLVEEDLFYDYDLSVNTGFYRYNIRYSDK